jgi:hypothetical protein
MDLLFLLCFCHCDLFSRFSNVFEVLMYNGTSKSICYRPVHSGTKHYIKRELGPELSVARSLLVRFLGKKVHSKAYVVTELRS